MTSWQWRTILALFLSISGWTIGAETAPNSVGYIIEIRHTTPEDPDGEVAEEDENAEPAGHLARNGQNLPVSEGMEVFAGDVIATKPNRATGVAFLDSSVVTLRPDSRLKIDDYGYPEKKVATHVTVESGRAFFSIQPRPDDAHFFVRTELGQVEVKGTKFEVFTTASAAGLETTVSVTDGSVVLNQNGPVMEIVSGTQVALKIARGGTFNAAPGAELKKGNLTKDQIVALKSSAILDVQISVGKKRDIKIKSISKNCDGTITLVKLTEVNGKRVQMQTVVLGADKKSLSKVTDKRSKKSSQVVDGPHTIKIGTDGGTGKVTMKDAATKESFKGTVSTLANGVEVSVATAKSGKKIVFTRQTLPDGTRIESKTVFEAGATQGKQTTRTYRTNCDVEIKHEEVTSAQLPDGDFQNVDGTFADYEKPPPPIAPEPPSAFTESTLLNQQPVSP